MSGMDDSLWRRPHIMPLGDSALLVRFGTSLDDEANQATLTLAARLDAEPIFGVLEVVPSLVSVLLRYDPLQISPGHLAGEIALRLGQGNEAREPHVHDIAVVFDGVDLAEVAAALGLSENDFIAQHNAAPLRVLTTGFAPGFVYCGLHSEALVLPRRTQVRPSVPVGSVLFAAGQTAITATEVPTGWNVIGSTSFRNFVPQNDPPTRLQAGDLVRFVVAR
ncbi:allophanate hydrolase subunit 1 [Devosia sp. XJ19-1]|nr:allophanate hydrolase subunit 1 [Devosia ureilytica]MCP8882073.1 allophanate hydrolase subunit 1 [Devosia ureilytica]